MSLERRVTILGCGSSGGVPRLGGDAGRGAWGACDPAEPRNRRRRCSVLIEQASSEGVTRVLVDTGPDMREQLLGARVATVDAVLYTHDHADHTNGIDDLRLIFLQTRSRVPVWADARTAASLRKRFDYVVEQLPGSGYPPILSLHEITEPMVAGAEPLTIDGPGGALSIRPFRAEHGEITSLGFRVGDMAYLPDANGLDDAAWRALEALDLWIVDALRYTHHPAHANLETALEWIERAAPKRAVLTNMHVDLDYRTVAAETPDRVEPAYDGMVLAF